MRLVTQSSLAQCVQHSFFCCSSLNLWHLFTKCFKSSESWWSSDWSKTCTFCMKKGFYICAMKGFPFQSPVRIFQSICVVPRVKRGYKTFGLLKLDYVLLRHVNLFDSFHKVFIFSFLLGQPAHSRWSALAMHLFPHPLTFGLSSFFPSLLSTEIGFPES